MCTAQTYVQHARVKSGQISDADFVCLCLPLSSWNDENVEKVHQSKRADCIRVTKFVTF